jgi:peptidoglycan/xylan/chitin deacetylase (PgdA/CDA1 family)
MSLAKQILFAVYQYCGYVQVRDWLLARLGRSRAVVVYYHRVGGNDVLSKPLDTFRRELAYFRKHFECMTLQELCIRLRSRMPLRRAALVVTFDDGYRDNYTHAVPALLEAGLPATFFVATGFIGTRRVLPHDIRAASAGAEPADEAALAARYPLLTWDDLAAMEAGGMEIGSHTVDHTNLGCADAATIRREITESLATLDRELGAKPRAFSFPWGKPQDICPDALRAVRQAGYYAAASAYGGANHRDGSVWNIRRVDVGNGRLSPLAVRSRVAGLDLDYLRLRLKRAKV